MDAVAVPPKPQRKRITPKQQRYAELRAQGRTQGQAALEAGFHSKTGAYRAERNPIVRGYLNEIQRNAAVRVGYVVATAMAEAKDAMSFARETENATAYVKAVELRAKLSGLLIDRVEVVSMDLKGALAMAEARIVNPPALIQTPQAEQQTDERNRVNP